MRAFAALLLMLGCAPKAPVSSAAGPRHVKAAGIVEHPGELTYPVLAFTVPNVADHRHQLSNGAPVFVAASDDLPLVTLTMTFAGGGYLAPAGKTGIEGLTAELLRTGGTETMTPEAVDDRLAFLAAEVRITIGQENGRLQIDCLRDNLDEALTIALDLLRRPRLDQTRLDLARSNALDRMRSRNDRPQEVASREMERLLWGEAYYQARVPTAAEMRSITRDDIRAFGEKVFHPGNLIVRVTGDIAVEPMLARLEDAIAGWTARERAPYPPASTFAPVPGVYHVAADIPQGTVILGHRGTSWRDPDYHAVLVMNHILGGGGFSARLTSRIRSDEGLAYGVSSHFEEGGFHPGNFTASVGTKSSTVALAIQILLEELGRIRDEPVTEAELESAKETLINSFPSTFETDEGSMQVMATDVLFGRDTGTWWPTWRERIAAVTVADVQRVARSHIRPDDLVVLVVGDWDAIAPGDPEGRATMAAIRGGEVTHLPARDPLTQEPVTP